MILPLWLIYLLIVVVGSIFLGIVVFLLIRHFVHHKIMHKHHDLAGFIIGTLGVLYSVFLGFTIVHAQDRYIQITSHVSREAYFCADLYRIAVMIPGKKDEIQKAIGAYIKSIIEDEWPLMSKQEESPKTLKELENLWLPFYTFEPKTEKDRIWFSKALQILFEFNSARLARIYSTWYSLSNLSWTALIIGALVLISLLYFFGTENMLAHILLNSIFIGYLALMIYTVYALEHPFIPPEAVEPKAYEVVYNYYHQEHLRDVSPERESLLPK